jgi:hypothetical protein
LTFNPLFVIFSLQSKEGCKMGVCNYTGQKKRSCPLHGAFSGSTSIANPEPTCPKCRAEKEYTRRKKERAEYLSALILALKENPDMAIELKITLGL